ncbi:MAG: hypothetical protein WB607_14585 [Candidatus Acidiferrum sp.]|jgi:hypothetical protein
MNDTTAVHPTETRPPAKLIVVAHPILIALVLLLTGAATPLRAQTGSLTCVSNDGDDHYCRAKTQNHLQLVPQLSSPGCRPNYSRIATTSSLPSAPMAGLKAAAPTGSNPSTGPRTCSA